MDLQNILLETEYVRNLNCNYERLQLEKKPEENRYQYCILSRGGIRFLLSCSLRYINDEAFLYYDISSKQNMSQIFERRAIKREWMKDFLWGMERMQQELGRYLLEVNNIVWGPEHIYQDLERNDFYFMYVPYCDKNSSFKELLNFWVEHIDYEDEMLVEFVYGLHEQYDLSGNACVSAQLCERFREAEKQEKKRKEGLGKREEQRPVVQEETMPDPSVPPITVEAPDTVDGRKGFLSFMTGRRKRQKPVSYQEILRNQVGMQMLGAVSEDITYDGGEEGEEYGRTVYLEQREERCRGLYRNNGELVVRIDKLPFVIGKKKGEVDYVLEDCSASRLHARILEEDGCIYLEDMNSTNGTFKNGLRMQPYEKRRLEKDDELRFGREEYIFQ
ncbi:MAG: FHA domain-containing protein [bacterium]|nr:FHA domain-containing protein [bacterium]MCM1374691.1 FHA domain-containing protein [Muribaculum sp.]